MLKNYTPLTLWKDFDPTECPLESSLYKTFDKDGVTVQIYTFCGRKIGKQSSRVLAYVAFKPQKKEKAQPALIVVDPLNRVNVDNLCFWAKLGYTAIGIDYLGESEEHGGLMTIYPVSLAFADFDNAKDKLYTVTEDAQKTCWYEWTLNTRRAVTFAQSLAQVDGEKIGLYSLKEGNVITLQAMAIDQRIKAGAVLHGNLWENVEEVDDSGFNSYNVADLERQMEESCRHDEWLAAISPQSYLSYVKQPFYTCVGTNSPNTDMDKTYDCLLRMGNNGAGVVLFAPRMMDSLPSNYTSNLQKWFDHLLRERSNIMMQNVNVKIDVFEQNKQLVVKARATDLPVNAKASLYYCHNRVGTESSRNWIEVPMKRTDDGLVAALQIYSPATPITAFCNVTFRNGVNISSNLLKFVPSKKFDMSNVTLSRRTPILYNNSQEEAEFTPMNIMGTQTTEFIDRHPVSFVVGAQGIKGVCGTNMGSFVVCDDKVLYNEHSLLMLDAYSVNEQDLNVYLIYHWGEPTHAAYKRTVRLAGGNIWQKITLARTDFKNEQTGKSPEMRDIRAICFGSKDGVVLNNILFT